MQTVLYIDVLVAINVFVTYFLLLASAAVAKIGCGKLRILLAALLGGAYSLIILLPEIHIVLSVLLKLVMLVTIIFTAFGFKNKRRFARITVVFFLVNFLFAGLMLAIWLTLKPNGMMFNNGTVYFDISILTLAVTTAICYAVITVCIKLFKSKAPDNKRYTVCVELGDKCTSG